MGFGSIIDMFNSWKSTDFFCSPFILNCNYTFVKQSIFWCFLLVEKWIDFLGDSTEESEQSAGETSAASEVPVPVPLDRTQCCGSGSGRIRNEFKVKLPWKTGKIWQVLNKNTQFKNINSHMSKNISLRRFISCPNEQPIKLTRQEYKR